MIFDLGEERRYTVITREKPENCNEHRMISEKMDFEQQKLEPCQDFGCFPDKGRAFSTSTPVVHGKLSDGLPPRSLSTSAWSPNDSGYGDSLCTSSPNSETSHTTQESFTQFRLTKLDLSPSPTSTNKSKGKSLSTDKHVPKFSLGLHSLDYEIPEEEQVFEKFSPNKIPIPRYSLEDEDMSVEESEDLAIPLLSNTQTLDLTARFNAVLEQCMPRIPDRAIGRKMGLDNVDLISELTVRGMQAIIAQIVSYLDTSDIRRMCRVSKTWRSVCGRWTVQKSTRKSRLQRKGDKENAYRKVVGDQESVGRGLTVGEQTTLGTLQVVQDRSPLPCSIGTQRDLFVQTAQSLKNEEKMTKCPMCQQAAIVHPVMERGLCQSEKCQFDYCIKCFHPFHQSRPCESLTVIKRTKDSKIGGKRGKKFLRRL
uniref:F-box only protein 43-like n=1 Tax=Crassostrea virginica TaxID=6565 RepID=A0A8B8D7P2_CRAVI|nr:F-box only protein 43-like [Crassostrea virginica]